jgi:hypothetical protein
VSQREVSQRGRTVFVGDLHACRDELVALLDWIGFGEGDRLVCVGDLVVRGPFPRATLDLLRDLGALAVRGNHDDKLVRWHAAPKMPLNEQHRKTAVRLRKRHWAFLTKLPLWLDLPDHGVRVVHAGVVPGVPIEQQESRALLYMRSLGADGEAIEQRDKILWGARYTGPPHIVFGHNAMPAPQIHPWATGLDTGCVYGGRLTALVLRAGEKPPPVETRQDALVSVPARRRYASS